jgi:hypothetical protein
MMLDARRWGSGTVRTVWTEQCVVEEAVAGCLWAPVVVEKAVAAVEDFYGREQASQSGVSGILRAGPV